MGQADVMTDVPAKEPYHVKQPLRNGGFRLRLNGHENAQRTRSSAIRDVIELQKEMKERALDPKTPVHHKAACARAWTDLSERLRILRGQPLPGQLRPTGDAKPKRGKRPGATPTAETESKDPSNNVTPLPVVAVSHVTQAGDPVKEASAQ